MFCLAMNPRIIKNCGLGGVQSLARDIAKQLRPMSVICLRGDLGAGKTTFTKYLIESLLDCKQEITSPTFNLVHTYDTKVGKVWHFDLYRLKDADEVYELGIEDAFSAGITIIEWPEIIEDLLPDNVINISLEFAEGGNSRNILIG